ncbi:MAG: glycosyltransferase [Deltaproteobacteria bacterium]|nr:glycosyltransferase [Deltaproteobacteria bacterium]
MNLASISPRTICDITQFYGITTGGIKTYIDEKRRFIQNETPWRHILIAPGKQDRAIHDGRLSYYKVAAPPLPCCPAYRFITNHSKVLAIIERERPDLIEVGSWYMLPWVALRFRKQHGTPIVAFYHTDFPRAYLEKPLKDRRLGTLASAARRLGESYVRLLSRRFNAVVAASNSVARRLQSMGVHNVEIVPLGVDVEIFNPSKRSQDVRERLGIASGEALLIYVGRLDREKRVSVLISAFNLIKDCWPGRFLIVGDGPSKIEAINATKVNPRLIYQPYSTNRDELAALLASADIYVTAGPDETFGLSIAEAQASGLAVVGVAAGALIDRVPEGAGLLGAVDSPEELAINLLRCLSLKSYRSMGAFARKVAADNLSWKKTFTTIISLYEKCIAEEQRRAEDPLYRCTDEIAIP